MEIILNHIKNIFKFNIKTGYSLEQQIPEINGLQGHNHSKVIKKKKGRMLLLQSLS